jgi:hypothetical protein
MKREIAANAGIGKDPTVDDRIVDPTKMPTSKPTTWKPAPDEKDPATYPASPPVKPNPLERPKGPPSR